MKNYVENLKFLHKFQFLKLYTIELWKTRRKFQQTLKRLLLINETIFPQPFNTFTK